MSEIEVIVDGVPTVVEVIDTPTVVDVVDSPTVIEVEVPGPQGPAGPLPSGDILPGTLVDNGARFETTTAIRVGTTGGPYDLPDITVHGDRIEFHANAGYGVVRLQHPVVNPAGAFVIVRMPNMDGTIARLEDIEVTAGDLSVIQDAVDDLTQVVADNAAASVPTSALGVTVATLVGGVLPTAQIPAVAITEFLGSVANQAAMLALTGQKGDWAIRADTGSTWVITGNDPTQLTDWTPLSHPAAPVTTVNGQAGAVVLSYGDVGADPAGAAAAAQVAAAADATAKANAAAAASATAAQGAKADSALQPIVVGTPSSSAGVLTLDFAGKSRAVFAVSLTENITSIVHSNVPAGVYLEKEIHYTQASAGTYTVAQPASHKALGGSDTVVSTGVGKVTVQSSSSVDGGTTWRYAMQESA